MPPLRSMLVALPALSLSLLAQGAGVAPAPTSRTSNSSFWIARNTTAAGEAHRRPSSLSETLRKTCGCVKGHRRSRSLRSPNILK